MLKVKYINIYKPKDPAIVLYWLACLAFCMHDIYHDIVQNDRNKESLNKVAFYLA